MDFDKLSEERQAVGVIDECILNLLAERKKAINIIGKYKKENSLEIRQLEIENEKLRKLIASGVEKGLDQEMVVQIFTIIFKDSCKSQLELK